MHGCFYDFMDERNRIRALENYPIFRIKTMVYSNRYKQSLIQLINSRSTHFAALLREHSWVYDYVFQINIFNNYELDALHYNLYNQIRTDAIR